MNLWMILDTLRSTIFAVVVLGGLPLLWWLCLGRKENSFHTYFGFVKPQGNIKNALVCIFVYFAVWGLTHVPAFTQYTQPSANAYVGLGSQAIIPVFIVSFIQNGTLEEFIFRGFIGKRFVKLLGMRWGILFQAFIFATVHILLSSGGVTLPNIIIFVTTAIGGYMLGYITEKSFNGSILPAIFLHGLGNFVYNLIQAFH